MQKTQLIEVKNPKVSVIIPVYNREQFLSQAISSVLQQNFTDFELIICDDGSTDNSLEIAYTYANQDKRIHVLKEKINRGSAYTLKKGFEEAKGEYLCQLDSDDLLDGDTLQKTVSILDDKPNIGLVYTYYQDINEDGKRLHPGWRCSYEYTPLQILTVFMLFHFRLFRKSIYQRVGGIDLNFDKIEDYDLCLRLSEVTEIFRIPEFLYLYRNHSDSTHNKYRLESIQLTIKAIEAALIRRKIDKTHRLDVKYCPEYSIQENV